MDVAEVVAALAPVGRAGPGGGAPVAGGRTAVAAVGKRGAVILEMVVAPTPHGTETRGWDSGGEE